LHTNSPHSLTDGVGMWAGEVLTVRYQGDPLVRVSAPTA
jgi:hypothetical protein